MSSRSQRPTCARCDPLHNPQLTHLAEKLPPNEGTECIGDLASMERTQASYPTVTSVHIVREARLSMYALKRRETKGSCFKRIHDFNLTVAIIWQSTTKARQSVIDFIQ